MTPENMPYDVEIRLNGGKVCEYEISLKQCKENEDALEQIFFPLYVALAVMGWEDY